MFLREGGVNVLDQSVILRGPTVVENKVMNCVCSTEYEAKQLGTSPKTHCNVLVVIR